MSKTAKTDAPPDDLLADALDVNPREARVNVRLTQLERAKWERCSGTIGLSDWVRQICNAATENQPARPLVDPTVSRRTDQLITRLGIRVARLELLLLEVLRMSFELGAGRSQVDRMKARDFGQEELERFVRRFDRDPRSDPEPADQDSTMKEILAAMIELKDCMAQPPDKRWRLALKAKRFRG